MVVGAGSGGPPGGPPGLEVDETQRLATEALGFTLR